MILQQFSSADYARSLFSDTVAMGWADPKAPMPRLLGDEVLAIEQVSAPRAREFASGRAAARNAMEQLGHMPRPVLQGDDRAPIWPAGLVGSITHTGHDALAVVTDDPAIRALGIDMELATPLEPNLWPVICTQNDLLWLAALGPTQRGNFAKLLFSAKEAVYKAQYQISRCLIDFHALDLTPDLATMRFTAILRQDVPGFAQGTRIDGRFLILASSIICAVEMRSK
ncbi:4'-phosphopantetheinyl transferase family protein [Roseinatronobacter alkalisoli]|uniref:Enterobactin synthase component D n=1 Tax=Roseinatronobacter alkalisoli TaxID=3028235 RepID=A0ABT5T8U0_9RHOB|nr:4'-phosphopantetheinyl transferase superfamily protein [Roseinatronobacter sp. HJB301]MDD7971545.1 4'-phosphopantetheinyl transferase superfamily protein [Roseinatronobacter sp. HJB301]